MSEIEKIKCDYCGRVVHPADAGPYKRGIACYSCAEENDQREALERVAEEDARAQSEREAEAMAEANYHEEVMRGE